VSRFLFVVPPLIGHIIQPTAVAQQLTRRGHEVAWVGSEARLRPWVGPDATVYGTGMRLFRAQPDTGMTAVKSLWEGFIVPFARFTLPSVEKAVAAFGPDVLVSDHQSVAGALVAQRQGLTWASSCVSALDLGRPFRGLPEVEAWMHRQLETLAVEAGLPASQASGLLFSPRLAVIHVSPGLIGEDPYPASFAFVGPAFGARPPVPDFPWDWLDPARRTVLVTVGTLADRQVVGFNSRVIEALRPLGDRVQGIVVGPAEPMRNVPGHVLVLPRVPVLELMPRLDVVICHGGLGTVSEALAHGVPVVVAPLARDQPVTASLVVRSGAGLRVHFHRARPEAFRAAVLALLTDPRYRIAARRVRDAADPRGGAVTAAELLERVHA
jgi:zeaxanthin glucosyltransferase